MSLYIRQDLVKAAPGPQENQTGEQRGGAYAARIQTGYEKDGSPKYKYFKTLADRDKYLAGKGKTDARKDEKKDRRGAEKLKQKLGKQQEKSKKKQQQSKGKVEGGLFVKEEKRAEKTKATAKKESDKSDKDKDEEDPVKKSIPVFIWSIE